MQTISIRCDVASMKEPSGVNAVNKANRVSRVSKANKVSRVSEDRDKKASRDNKVSRAKVASKVNKDSRVRRVSPANNKDNKVNNKRAALRLAAADKTAAESTLVHSGDPLATVGATIARYPPRCANVSAKLRIYAANGARPVSAQGGSTK